MAESRGATEDRQLKSAYQDVYESGSLHHRNPDFYRRVLTSKELKLKNKQANIAGFN